MSIALKLIQFLTVSNLFPLEVVQKCQLCVLRENSFVRHPSRRLSSSKLPRVCMRDGDIPPICPIQGVT